MSHSSWRPSSGSSSGTSSSANSSDLDERFKNVHKLLVSSNASDEQQQREVKQQQLHAYKRKLGDLIFDANFETGNLGRVERVDRFTYDLMLRPDVTAPRHRVWFNFCVSNQRPGQCVLLTLVNLSEELALLAEHRLGPVVRSRSAPNWVRLKPGQLFYYRSPAHQNRRVLTIAFRFSSTLDWPQVSQQAGEEVGQLDDEHQFALFYPYGISRWTNFLERWTSELKRRQRRRNGAKFEFHFKYQFAELSRSTLNKPIYLLQVTGQNHNQQQQQQQVKASLAVVVLGQTSGCIESVSSLVCQGLVDLALGCCPLARAFRARCSLTALPMLDPDASWVGNARTDLMGQTQVDAELLAANPKLYASQQLVRAHLEQVCREHERTVVIELRANLNLLGARTISRRQRNPTLTERHLHLPRLLARFSSVFYLENCLFDSQQETRSLFDLSNDLPERVDFYRLELSPIGYLKRALTGRPQVEPLEQQKYLQLGKALACALIELTRPRVGELPAAVTHYLASFKPGAHDVDDLVLVQPPADSSHSTQTALSPDSLRSAPPVRPRGHAPLD